MDMNQMVPLVLSEEFLNIWREVNDRYVPWKEFKTFPMPEGVSVDTVWKATTALRRYAGIELPFVPFLPDSGKNVVWFSLPLESQEALQRIMSEASPVSYLGREVVSRNNPYFQIWLIWAEVISAFRRDGIACSEGELPVIYG